MSPANPQPVSRDAIDSLIAHAALTSSNPAAGLFGPTSITWRINRESALFLGAGRAALLQLAHPWVATALQQHSTLIERPIARFHSTFRIVFTMVFGSLAQATAAARHLYTTHTAIQGELTEPAGRYPRGSHYEANEIAALRWVFATLVESAVLAYEFVRPPLTHPELAAYYAESRTLAALFGLPADALPADWQSFLTYCREMEQSNQLGVTASARTMAQSLLAGAGSWIKPPCWYRALTTQWLVPRFRAEFGLLFGPREQHSIARAQRRLTRLYRALPKAARFVGPYHEAQSRLAGRPPGPAGRSLNRFWIGEPRMPFADEVPRP
ncbi:MAG TPA: oxygenase MpaB family protein [Terracidiphilus sp.]|nr:oxygenase MpaB family protein [Terracidiphilus sp.]